ncbi:hypothetical protein [Pseudooceanicola flagellatus]|uniref:hypothetical protein n=1 Tax=Primorskyibacter TaxID=1068904 RepID=UPI000A063C6D
MTCASDRLCHAAGSPLSAQAVIPETVPMLLWALLVPGGKVDGWETPSRSLEPMPLGLVA